MKTLNAMLAIGAFSGLLGCSAAAPEDGDGVGTEGEALTSNSYFYYPELLWWNGPKNQTEVETISSNLGTTTSYGCAQGPSCNWVFGVPAPWYPVGAAGNTLLWQRSDTWELSFWKLDSYARFDGSSWTSYTSAPGWAAAIAVADNKNCSGYQGSYLVLFDTVNPTANGRADLWVMSDDHQLLDRDTIDRSPLQTAAASGFTYGPNDATGTPSTFALWTDDDDREVTPGYFEIDQYRWTPAQKRFAMIASHQLNVGNYATDIQRAYPGSTGWHAWSLNATSRDVTSPYNTPKIRYEVLVADGVGHAGLLEYSATATNGLYAFSYQGFHREDAPSAMAAGDALAVSFAGEAQLGCGLEY
jgi:hypothetical protein